MRAGPSPNYQRKAILINWAFQFQISLLKRDDELGFLFPPQGLDTTLFSCLHFPQKGDNLLFKTHKDAEVGQLTKEAIRRMLLPIKPQQDSITLENSISSDLTIISLHIWPFTTFPGIPTTCDLEASS